VAPAAVWTNGATAGGAYTAGTLDTTSRTLKNLMFGATHNMGALTLKASYGTAAMSGGQATASTARAVANIESGAKSTQLALGAVYDLSKRTAMYGTMSRLSTKGQNTNASMGLASAAAVGLGGSNTANGIDLGLRHRF
jgi:predicted porin